MNRLESADATLELLLTRTFDAPLSLVWTVWTDPKHASKWWGPHGFTTPVFELDLRPGGKKVIHMQGPDGTIYPMTGTVEEVIANERLVTSGVVEFNGAVAFNVRMDVAFAEYERKTTVTVRQTFTNLTVEGKAAVGGARAGWTQQFERLDDYLRARV